MLNEFSADIKQDKLSPAAFVFYSPKTKETEMVYYNPEAWNILSQSLLFDKRTIVLSDINALCLKWKNSFDKIHKEASGNHELGDMVNYCVDMFESYRRKYIVRATVLVNKHSLQALTKRHLFILERFSPQNLNLSETFRQWNLSQREQQIAKLLIEDCSNKEIARILALSTNTVKVYIRFLMTKLNAASRTGIVSKLLSKTG